jgi:hypothetical protein
LLTIEKKLTERKYVDKKQFIDDFGKIFNNCRKYNSSTSIYYKSANDVEKVLKPSMDKLSNPSEEELAMIKKEAEKFASTDNKKGDRTVSKRKLKSK